MASQVLERKIVLLFTYRKIVIIFKSVELEHTPFRQASCNQKGDQRLCDQKKKKKKKKPALVGYFFMFLRSQRDHHSKNNKIRSRVNNKDKIAFSLTSKVPDWPSAFHSESSKQVPLLGLLLRGCRPKSRPLPARVEVIQPVVRACTTFWLTSTRITLTRVHRLCPVCSVQAFKALLSFLSFHPL